MVAIKRFIMEVTHILIWLQHKFFYMMDIYLMDKVYNYPFKWGRVIVFAISTISLAEETIKLPQITV